MENNKSDQSEDDPTFIMKIMDEFRYDGNPRYRTSMLPPPLQHKNTGGKPRFLDFDDSDAQSSSHQSEKRLKLDESLRNPFEGSPASPWDIRRLKSEVSSSRVRIIEMERRLEQTRLAAMAKEVDNEKNQCALEENLRLERNKVVELEAHLKHVQKRELAAIEEMKKMQMNYEERSFYSRASVLTRENEELREKLKAKNEAEDMSDYIEGVEELKKEIQRLKEGECMRDTTIKRLQGDVNQKNVTIQKFELEHVKLQDAVKQAKDLEREREIFIERLAYVDSQSKKLMKYPQLEKELAELEVENKRLKASITSTLYLEHEVEDLRRRHANVENLQQRLVQVQTENQEYRLEMEKWGELCKRYCRWNENQSDAMDAVRQRFEELLKNELLLVNAKTEAKFEIEHLKENVEALKTTVGKISQELEGQKSSCESYMNNIRRLKRQLSLVSIERNDLRDLLECFQKDTTIVNADMASDYNNLTDVLQRVIEGYKERTRKLEQDPSLIVISGMDVKPSALLLLEKEEWQKRENALREENASLLAKVENLNERLQTKIIHLKRNPADEAFKKYDDELKNAKEEVIKLTEKIRVMRENSDVVNVTGIVEEGMRMNYQKENEVLKENLKSAELKSRRLCEAFKDKSKDFREGVYRLLGYKVDSLMNGQYRLSSMFAESPEDVLLFQDSNNVTNLLQSDFSQAIPEFIDLYLKQTKSIPVFLSHLTIDLFNRQTLLSTQSMSSTVNSTINQ